MELEVPVVAITGYLIRGFAQMHHPSMILNNSDWPDTQLS
jgi:hypothetical protein